MSRHCRRRRCFINTIIIVVVVAAFIIISLAHSPSISLLVTVDGKFCRLNIVRMLIVVMVIVPMIRPWSAVQLRTCSHARCISSSCTVMVMSSCWGRKRGQLAAGNEIVVLVAAPNRVLHISLPMEVLMVGMMIMMMFELLLLSLTDHFRVRIRARRRQAALLLC